MSGAIVVTGASGFIGRNLVARLMDEGRTVVAPGRTELQARDGSLQRSLAGAHCIVHLAARAHRGGADPEFEHDVALTQSLARMASQGGARRFLLLSSIGVLGTSTHGTPFTESTTPSPKEPYARAKLRAEHALQGELSSSATEWTILRPPMVHGPQAPGNFARLVRAVQRGRPLPFSSVRNRRCLVGIENLLDAIELCIDHDAAARQTFVVGDETPVSTPELVNLIAQGVGAKPRLWAFPPDLLGALARLAGRGRMAESLLGDLEIDAAHIRRTLGWIPRIGAHEGIVQAAASFRQ
jgi:nucleoside-diphosphate-sugar epimerase